MKRILPILLLLATSTLHAQSISLLTGLHPRPQVSYVLADSQTTHIDKTWSIVYDMFAPHAATNRTIAWLQRNIKLLIGDTLKLYKIDTTEPGFGPGGPSIIIAEKYSNIVRPMDSLNKAECYSLHIDDTSITLIGADTSGTFNGVSTLAQLIAESNNSIPSLHIYDWPDYPIRWVFSLHNLIDSKQISQLESIEDTMAAHKLNGLQQNDFKNNIYSVFEGSYPQYFYNVDSLQAYSQKTNVELIPGLIPIGWSEGILFHDPDLAEGIPTTCSYLIESDTGRLIPDPRVSLPNGNFENATSGRFPGWGWVDTTIHVDSVTVHSGKYSARAENFNINAPNARFIKTLVCSPHHGYHLSAWFKTQNFSGSFNLEAIGFHGSRSQTLTFPQFSYSATMSDWQQANIIFNTLDYDSLYVYCGVWSGAGGTIWMDDFQIEDAGMTNLLRRPSELPTVTAGASPLIEGRDYATLVDSIMEQAGGNYTWHASPSFKLVAGSKIKNGDTVQVHFIRPNPTINDLSGNGSQNVCFSEDTLYSILGDQLSLVDQQYHANRYFMSHDEIREMNWDSACLNRHLTAAQLLANNVSKCDSIMHGVRPNLDIFDWSDMIDSLHNAHNDYYLVNGDLTGDWNLIPNDFTVVNWNGAYMDSSLAFFARHGYSQITSPYYDDHSTANIRAWRIAMEHEPKGMRGMMYTTWASDYSYVTPFADYAWSAGPMIVHQPIDASKITNGEYVEVNATVFADPYNPTDSIVNVTHTLYYHVLGKDQSMTYKMFPDAGHVYRCTNLVQSDSGYDVTYVNQATDLEGITRATPRYVIFHASGIPAGSATVQDANPEEQIGIYPNPASDRIAVTLPNSFMQNYSLQIVNTLGVQQECPSKFADRQIVLDTHALPAGTYTLSFKSGSETMTKPFAIVR